jgi:hypothetical protein
MRNITVKPFVIPNEQASTMSGDPGEKVPFNTEEPEDDTATDSEDDKDRRKVDKSGSTAQTPSPSKGWIWLLVWVILNAVVWICLIGYVRSVQPPVYIQLQNIQSRLVPST